MVGDFEFDEPDTTQLTPEQRDSIAAVEETRQAEEEKMDSAVNNPHKREFYLAQIPFTEEALAESNEIIKDGSTASFISFGCLILSGVPRTTRT